MSHLTQEFSPQSLPKVKNHRAKIAQADLFKLPLNYCIATSLSKSSPEVSLRHSSRWSRCLASRAWVQERNTGHLSTLISALRWRSTKNCVWSWEPQVHLCLRLTPKNTLPEWNGGLKTPTLFKYILFFSQEAQSYLYHHISKFLFGILPMCNARVNFFFLSQPL